MLDITDHYLGVIRGETARPARVSDVPQELIALLKGDMKRELLIEHYLNAAQEIRSANMCKPRSPQCIRRL